MKFRNEDHISAKYVNIWIFYEDLNCLKFSISLHQQKIITLGLSATALRKMPERFLCIEIFFPDLKKKIFLYIEMSILHFSQCTM